MSKHLGSSFDDFLKKDGTLEHCTEVGKRRAKSMSKQNHFYVKRCPRGDNRKGKDRIDDRFAIMCDGWTDFDSMLYKASSPLILTAIGGSLGSREEAEKLAYMLNRAVADFNTPSVEVSDKSEVGNDMRRVKVVAKKESKPEEEEPENLTEEPLLIRPRYYATGNPALDGWQATIDNGTERVFHSKVREFRKDCIEDAKDWIKKNHPNKEYQID